MLNKIFGILAQPWVCFIGVFTLSILILLLAFMFCWRQKQHNTCSYELNPALNAGNRCSVLQKEFYV